jgi:hypothetical protein
VQYVNPWDFILVPMLLGLAYFLARRRQERDIEENDAYRFYVRAKMFKLFGGLALAAVYAFYYGGGDTVNYWEDAGYLARLTFRNLGCALDIFMGNLSIPNYYCFDVDIRPYYYLKDPQSYTVTRLTAIPYILTIKAFFACSIVVAWIAFGGVWRLYMVFVGEYPRLKKEMAICILFIPSVVFWGSGILKDTYTFSAVCWMTVAVYGLLIKREKIIFNVICLIVSAWILIAIKPYIFVAMLPGSFIWVVFNKIQSVENVILRLLIAPIMLMVGAVGVGFIFSQASSSLGAYGSVDTMLEKAVVTQNDLKQEYYGGQTFDIGEFDATIGGVLSKAPIAIYSGLFRPMPWEAGSIFMVITALENSLILLFFLFMLVKIGPLRYIRGTLSEPMSMFAFVFAIFFAFAVGLTTANFGSLVRYKIPAIPFFLASIYIARDRRLRQEEDEEDVVVADSAVYGR